MWPSFASFCQPYQYFANTLLDRGIYPFRGLFGEIHPSSETENNDEAVRDEPLPKGIGFFVPD